MKTEFITCTLKDIASSEKGSIISGPFGSNISSRFFQESGVPVIRGNNLSTNGAKKFIDNGFVFVSKEKADELNTYAKRGDLIFTAAGTIGQVGIIEKSSKYEEYVISNKQLRVRLDASKVNPLYAYYWFSSPWMFKEIVNKNTGSTVPLINLGIIKTLEIKIPKERVTQDRIVAILSALDAKIELNQQINDQLGFLAKTLYDYWFYQFDFPNDEGKPYKTCGGKMVWSVGLKREIPEGWNVEKIGNCCDIVDCLHSKKPSLKFENKEWYLLQLENIKENGLLNLSYKYYVSEKDYHEWTSRIEVTEDDIIITNAGRVAATAQIPKGIKTGIGRNITSIRPKTILPTYLFHAFSGLDMMRQIKWNTDSGAFFSSLNVRGIKELFVVRPPKQIEGNFETIVHPLRRKREVINSENYRLYALRDWLIPMLMNGQILVDDSKDESNKKLLQQSLAGLDTSAITN